MKKAKTVIPTIVLVVMMIIIKQKNLSSIKQEKIFELFYFRLSNILFSFTTHSTARQEQRREKKKNEGKEYLYKIILNK